MEVSINTQVLKHLEQHKLIHDRQYGFRHKRSTAGFTNTWNKSLELLGESQIVALDISKAFDQVWHDVF